MMITKTMMKESHSIVKSLRFKWANGEEALLNRWRMHMSGAQLWSEIA